MSSGSFWPDPLVPTNRCELAGVAAGVFLCELQIPAGFKGQSLSCSVEVAKDGGPAVAFEVPVEVVPLAVARERDPPTCRPPPFLARNGGSRSRATAAGDFRFDCFTPSQLRVDRAPCSTAPRRFRRNRPANFHR